MNLPLYSLNRRAVISNTQKGIINMCTGCIAPYCNSNCPNADEKTAIYECCNCGEDICEGDEYFSLLEDGNICAECASAMTVADLAGIAESTVKDVMEKMGIEGWEAWK